MFAALPFTLSIAYLALLMTGHLHPVTQSALQALRLAPGLEQISVRLTAGVLILSSLMANTVMTSMGNKAVRGKAVGVRDLFRLRGLGVTSFLLVITLLATALSSLLFYVGALIAAALLISAQSTALRTGSFKQAVRLSASLFRVEPVRPLVLAAFLILAVTAGTLTGGLGLLVLIPVSKIVGAYADAYAEALNTQGSLTAGSPERAPLPQPVRAQWTADEAAMLTRTVPPPHLPHILAALLVICLSALLLSPFPRLAAETTPPPDSQESAQPTPVAQPSPPSQAPPVTTAGTTVPGSGEGYGPDNFSPLPFQMPWGTYTVRLEKVGAEADIDQQDKLTVFDAAGSPVYTVVDDGIGLVKPEPLLGGEQPELLIHTYEGQDGTFKMDTALTQQGGVHDIFLLSNQENVKPIRKDDDVGEEVVVDSRVGGPYTGAHDYSILTSTYKWNGTAYANATASYPEATLDRISQYEQALDDPAVGADDVNRNEQNLMANAYLLGLSNVPDSVATAPGYQRSLAWLRADREAQDVIDREVSAARENLPAATSSSIVRIEQNPSQ